MTGGFASLAIDDVAARGVQARGDRVERGRIVGCDLVEAGIDVAQARRALKSVLHRILIQQRNDAGKNGGRNRCPADDGTVGCNRVVDAAGAAAGRVGSTHKLIHRRAENITGEVCRSEQGNVGYETRGRLPGDGHGLPCGLSKTQLPRVGVHDAQVVHVDHRAVTEAATAARDPEIFLGSLGIGDGNPVRGVTIRTAGISGTKRANFRVIVPAIFRNAGS